MVIISSGISSLDEIIGGGIPTGTISIIDEDVGGVYSKILLKYFLAEGIATKQSILIAGLDISPHNIMADLPNLLESTTSDSNKPNNDDRMHIAFRYQNLPSTDRMDIKSTSHNYDLSQSLPQETIDKCDVQYWTDDDVIEQNVFQDLLNKIKSKIENNKNNILRVVIHSFGSPMWLKSIDDGRELNKFMYYLRSMLKTSNAIALLSIPSYLYNQISIDRCVNCSDLTIKLQSFTGTLLEKNTALSNYHGFFTLTKFAPINSLTSKHPGCVEYGFKLKRKKFTIEVLHLPPDLSEVSDDKPVVGLGCYGPNKNLLEF